MATYRVGSELPDLALIWTDGNSTTGNPGGLIIDLTDYTFKALVTPWGEPTTSFVKTTGITGSATSPNLKIAWATTGELHTLTPGTYNVDIIATRNSDSKHRYMRTTIVIQSVPA